MQEVYEFLKKCGTFYLATVEEGGQPRVRPFGLVNLFEDKLYFLTGKVKNVSKQIAANNKVEICCFDGTTWLRVACTLVRDERVEAKEDLLNNFPTFRGMYSSTDDNMEVLYIKDAVATFSTFTDAPRTVHF